MYKHIAAGGLALAAVLAGSLIGAGVAHAEKADSTDSFHDEFSGPDEFLTGICGFDVWIEADVRGTVRFWDDGRLKAQEHGRVVLSNPDNGNTLTRTWAGQFRSHGTETIDGNILTIDFDDNYFGVQEKWMGPDGGVLIMDRGRANIVGQVIIDLGELEDPEDDEVLHFHQEFAVSGPHPILESGGLDPTLACDYLA